MRILCIGDIVGKPGRQIIQSYLPKIKNDYKIDIVIANAENIAGGNGITKNMADAIIRAGVDVITLGDHIWDQRCFETEIDSLTNACKPANLPPNNPGKEFVIVEKFGVKVLVFSLLGQTLMKIKADCPFRKAQEKLEEFSKMADFLVLDFHAETSSEKISIANLLDGKVGAIFGTHTHIPTADARIFPKGTAYITDIGMTGPWDGCLGRDKEAVLQRFIDGRPRAFAVAEEDPRICGCIIEVDEGKLKAKSISSFIFPKFGAERLVLNPENS